jgi:hypothetical protein
LSRDRVVAVAKCAAPIGPEVAWLREAARRHLAHGNGPNHLDGIRRRRLPQLPAGLGNIWVFRSKISGILVLAI